MIQLPDISPEGTFVVGNIAWGIVITGIITLWTRYKPLSVTQIQLLKGILSMLGYIISVAIINLPPEYVSVIVFAITAIAVFLISSGAYDAGMQLNPELVKSNIDAGDKNRGA